MMKSKWERSAELRWMLATVLVSLVMWEILVRLLHVQAFIFPPPSAVLMEFVSAPGYLLTNAMYTLTSTVAGFILAVILGVLMAIGIVYSVTIERVLYPYLVIFNSIPKVALAPIFVLWLGVGSAPKIAVAVMIAIFSIVIDTVLGLRSIDPDILNLAKVSRASNMRVLMRIRLPNALPSMFAGMKVGVSFALVGAIVGEFVAGEVGLGSVILQSQGSFDTARAFAAITLLAVMGTALFYAVELVERWMLPWHTSQRGKSGSSVIVPI